MMTNDTPTNAERAFVARTSRTVIEMHAKYGILFDVVLATLADANVAALRKPPIDAYEAEAALVLERLPRVKDVQGAQALLRKVFTEMFSAALVANADPQKFQRTAQVIWSAWRKHQQKKSKSSRAGILLTHFGATD